MLWFYKLLHSVVAIGVVLLPVPAVGAHLLDAVLSHPAQLVLGLGGVGVALRDITGAARVDYIGDLLTAGLGESVDHIQHAVALASAQIADEEAAAGLQLADGAHMAPSQIHNVDVVTHTGAVRGGVVVAKDVHLFQLAHSHLGNVGHQVVGDAVGVLADQAALVGTDGVEVAQQRHIQAGVSLADVLQNALGEGLGGAVGVGGSTHGEVLGDGHAGGVAIDGCGRAEHEVVAVVMAHHVQNDQRAVEVIIVVLDGLGHALAHSLVGCKLDDGGDVRALGEDLLHGPRGGSYLPCRSGSPCR